MNLLKKKILASKVLGVEKSRIVFLNSRLNEIKEAITKQDIRDLKAEGAILIREIKGRSKAKKGSRRTGPGKVKKKVNKRKRKYVILTRKLRSHVSGLRGNGNITTEEYVDLRKKIRNSFFKSKSHMREHIGGIKKWRWKEEE